MPKKTQKPEGQKNTVDGVTIDISDIDPKLKDKARRFIFWYCHPGTYAYQHNTNAAILAGYVAKNAKVTGCKLTKDPRVKQEIERISEAVVSERIDVMYNKYIDSLEQRAFFDVADFVSGKAFKSIDAIPAEKRIVIDQPVANREGEIVSLQLGDRRTAFGEIMKLHREKTGGNDDEFDIEATADIIKEQLSIRVSVRRKKEELSQSAGYIETPKESTVGEL